VPAPGDRLRRRLNARAVRQASGEGRVREIAAHPDR
jgi:hypothetical protein